MITTAGLLTGANPTNEPMNFVARIGPGVRVDFLGGAGFARGRIAFQLGPLGGAAQRDSLEHVSQGRGGFRSQNGPALGLRSKGHRPVR